MLEYNSDTTVSKEILVPLKIKAQQAVLGAEHLLEEKPVCIRNIFGVNMLPVKDGWLTIHIDGSAAEIEKA